MPTQREKLEAIQHVVYEYANLVSAGCMLFSGKDPTGVLLQPPVNTHVQDSFLLSCRKMADFFHKGEYKDDVKASHYIDLFTRTLPKTEKLTKHLNKNLAHVSYSRIKEKLVWDGKENAPLLEEHQKAWREFLLKLKGTGFHSKFEEEISRRNTRDGFEELNLR